MESKISDLKKKILIVDDSEYARLEIKQHLESANYVAIEATGAEEALSLLETIPDLDLAVIDHNMPGLTGIELAKRIRVLKAELPIIFLSAHGSDKLKLEAKESGASWWVMKPISKNSLLNVVKWCFDGSRKK